MIESTTETFILPVMDFSMTLMIRQNGMRGTHKVKVPHAPLQDVTLTRSLAWQPWLSRYTGVVDTPHGSPFGIPDAGKRNMLRGNNISFDPINRS